MITIYKYPLKLDGDDIAVVDLPLEAEPLHVELQNEQFFLWAMVDTDWEITEPTRIMVKGTGHKIPENLVMTHLNSFMAHQGRLVFHAFKVVF